MTGACCRCCCQVRALGFTRVTNGFDSRKMCDRRRYEYILPAEAFDPSWMSSAKASAPEPQQPAAGQAATASAAGAAAAPAAASGAEVTAVAEEAAAAEQAAAEAAAPGSAAGMGAAAADNAAGAPEAAAVEAAAAADAQQNGGAPMDTAAEPAAPEGCAAGAAQTVAAFPEGKEDAGAQEAMEGQHEGASEAQDLQNAQDGAGSHGDEGTGSQYAFTAADQVTSAATTCKRIDGRIWPHVMPQVSVCTLSEGGLHADELQAGCNLSSRSSFGACGAGAAGRDTARL